ncbi:MAG: nuclear transport factor 2 family protein [Actinomycetes bacterium]
MSPAPDYAHDVEELRNLGQRYARAVDDRQLDAVPACFTPDAVIDGIRGTTTITEFVAGLRDGAAGSGLHLLGAPLVTFTAGADVAALDTYAVVHRWSETAARTTLGMRYLDDVVRTGDGWRIAHRRTTLLWAD